MSAVLKAAMAGHRPRLTIRQVVQEISDSRHTEDVVGYMLNGKTPPSAELVETVRHLVGKPKPWPYDDQLKKVKVSAGGTQLEAIRVVGKVAAGEGSINDELEHEYVYVPANLVNLNGIGWTVEGDSMMPTIEPGTVAIVKEERRPRRGLVYLLRSPDGQMRLKMMEWDQEKGWVLHSTNPTYEDEPLGQHEMIGILVGIYSYRGTEELIRSDVTGLRI